MNGKIRKFSVIFVGLCQIARTAFCQDQIPNPWREVDGDTNNVQTSGVLFIGQVVDVMPNGIRVQGSYGHAVNERGPFGPLMVMTPPEYHGDFFVTNFPSVVFSDQRVSEMAFSYGTFSYNTVLGSSRTIPELNYGIPCDKPEWQIEAEKRSAENAFTIAYIQKNTHDAQIIDKLTQSAKEGDSGAQFSLAVHYRDGINCDTNIQQAIYWFSNSAAQGNLQASNELVELQTISTTNATIR